MDGFAFPVKVVRTDRRRTVSIQLDDDGVSIHVPRTLAERRIREIIVKRTPWITAKLKETAERRPIKPKEFISGEVFSYLGKHYRLKVLRGEERFVKLKEGYLQAQILNEDTEPEATLRSLVVGWYKEHAQERLQQKSDRYAKIIDVKPKSVAIKDYKSRWGSCSPLGDIRYNWRIILAPYRIVDYVVVHELCHLLEHNHSRKYWKCVKRYVADCGEKREWLKRNARDLLGI